MEYHVQQEQRVWERVMGTARQEESPNQNVALSAETVRTLAQKAQAAACLYRSLAQRVCPKSAKMLSQLAREKDCHARSLMAVYFVITGQKLCLSPQQKPCITCTAEELRRAYLAEKGAAEQYAALSADAEHAQLFGAMARDAARHARQLLCVIGESV